MRSGKIYLLLFLVILHTALGSPLLVVTITQISTFVAVLPFQTSTRWVSITAYVPANAQSTDLVLSTFSEALLSRVNPQQTFLVTTKYLTTLGGSDSSATEIASTVTTTTPIPTGVASSTTTDAAPQTAKSGQNFPTAATISISVVLMLIIIGLIAFCWRRQYRRKYKSAIKTSEMPVLQTEILGPSPPSKLSSKSQGPRGSQSWTGRHPVGGISKLSMSKRQGSGGSRSWKGRHQVGGVVHPGTAVDFSLNPIADPNSSPFFQDLPQVPYSSVDYSSRGSSAFEMSDIYRARSQTWGSTTTAIQSPEQHPGRFLSAMRHPPDSNSTQERTPIQEYQQSEPADRQSGQDSRWDEAIRRLNALGQNSLSPPPLHVVKHNDSTPERVSSPMDHTGSRFSRPATPVSLITASEIMIGVNSRAPNRSESIEGEREQTLATLEGAEVRRRYSPSVYSRMVDGTVTDDMRSIGKEESLEWHKMFDDGQHNEARGPPL